jgi:hypothetical protein
MLIIIIINFETDLILDRNRLASSRWRPFPVLYSWTIESPTMVKVCNWLWRLCAITHLLLFLFGHHLFYMQGAEDEDVMRIQSM